MDADDLEAPRAEVPEAVWSIGLDDDDVAWPGLDLFLIGRDECSAGANNPGLRIGVQVQARALAGLVVDEQERDPGSVCLALELDSPVGLGGRSSWRTT